MRIGPHASDAFTRFPCPFRGQISMFLQLDPLPRYSLHALVIEARPSCSCCKTLRLWTIFRSHSVQHLQPVHVKYDRGVSTDLFPPDQDTHSVCRAFGRWCKLGDERRIREGWCFSRYLWLRELGVVALVKARLNGYDIGVGVDCVFSVSTGFSTTSCGSRRIVERERLSCCWMRHCTQPPLHPHLRNSTKKPSMSLWDPP